MWHKLIKGKSVSHFKPKPLVIADRFSFHKRDKLPGEPVKDFIIGESLNEPHSNAENGTVVYAQRTTAKNRIATHY